ncbi:MAG: rhomboid family intramembrane serine protease [Candidatus Eremiobacteraeota bacterium]|nr:rhomboid family intramembrane serine protease [Candidatus Eremiobacteraeota bacterium]
MLTRLLVALNIIAFIWESLTGAFGQTTGYHTSHGDVIVYDPLVAHGAIYGPNVFGLHQYWRVITGSFLHANFLHILFNMIALWQVGTIVEIIAGTGRMGFIYFVSMVAAGFSAAWFNYAEPVVGASGAIFGLFGALVAIGMRLGPRGRGLIGQTLPIIAINLVITFTLPYIAASAHVGGLVAGFIAGLLVYQPPRPVRARVVDPSTGVEYESTVEP